MGFLLILLIEYNLVACLLIAIFWRDQKDPTTWLGKKRKLAWSFIAILFLGVIISLSTIFVYPNLLITKKEKIKINKNIQPIEIVFVSDIQIGNYKKTTWVEKIIQKIEVEKPDLILLGGDLIDNEGAFEDESQYLEPLQKLVGKYPIYAILGNHEYGIGSKTRTNKNRQTGDRSEELIARFQKIGIPILKNQLTCPQISNQTICIFGIDDIWNRQLDFTELKKYQDPKTPLIFLTHNPDGVLYWPTTEPKPDIVLAGHTHGGQIWLPLYGPLGLTDVDLGTKYYRGLNYWNDIPIYTSVGAGESAAPIRFWVAPEINKVTLY